MNSLTSDPYERIRQATLDRHGVTADEYDRITQLLGREPNLTELGMFSVMWSEHCSYKSSRVHLQTLPTDRPARAAGAGRERRRGGHRRRPRRGLQDRVAQPPVVHRAVPGRGDRRRRHHPRYLHDGRAADCAAELAALRPARQRRRTRRIVEGVVAGIGGYGNSIGIPTVGGEVRSTSRTRQPAGQRLLPRHREALRHHQGPRRGVGDPVYYVGAKTGRDGIHGATMASAEFDEKSAEKRPAVQVGDPFMEKLLLEACLEVMKTDALVGIQDMGAAGLTSRQASSRSFSMKGSPTWTAGRFSSGLLVELGRRHRRAMDAVAAGLGADVVDGVAFPARGALDDVGMLRDAEAEDVDERVAAVRLVEGDFAADRRNADAVAVAADAGDDAREDAAVLRGRRAGRSEVSSTARSAARPS